MVGVICFGLTAGIELDSAPWGPRESGITAGLRRHPWLAGA